MIDLLARRRMILAQKESGGVTIYDGYEINNESGNMVASTGKSCTGFIPASACKLVWSAGALGTTSNRYCLGLYDSNKNFLEYYSCNKGYRIIDMTTYARASEIAYIRITLDTTKKNTRICYDITNGEYIFKGDDYDGRYDNMNWGYKRVKDGSIYKNVADNTHAMTEELPLLAGCQSVTWDAGEDASTNYLLFVDADGQPSSNWVNTPKPRTVNDARLNNGTWRGVAMTISLDGLDGLDGSYFKDETNNTYLFKGINID